MIYTSLDLNETRLSQTWYVCTENGSIQSLCLSLSLSLPFFLSLSLSLSLSPSVSLSLYHSVSLPPAIGKYFYRRGSLNLVRQLGWENENSQLNPVKLHFQINIVSHFGSIIICTRTRKNTIYIYMSKI